MFQPLSFRISNSSQVRVNELLLVTNYALSKQELCGAHTPCAASQLHAARQLLVCFVYMFALPIGIYTACTCTGDARSILQEKKGSAVVVILHKFVCICSCHREC